MEFIATSRILRFSSVSSPLPPYGIDLEMSYAIFFCKSNHKIATFQLISKDFAFIKYDTSQKTLSQLSYLSQICDFSLVLLKTC